MEQSVKVLLKELATATQKKTELGVRKQEVDALMNADNAKRSASTRSMEINAALEAIERVRNALIDKIAKAVVPSTGASASRLPPLLYVR